MNINPACNDQDVDFLHEIGSRMAAAADPLHEVLARIVEFATELVKCDSCLIYVLEGEELVLRASKNPHAEAVGRLKIPMSQGITGGAEHREPVAVSQNAQQDPRFKFFHESPAEGYQAFLSVPVLSRGRLAGVINLQHRLAHSYNRRQVRLISTIGFLVGAVIETARLEVENCNLVRQLEARKVLERAKGILQRDLGMDEEQAYLTLQRQSRQKRKPLKEIAEAIVLREEVRRDSQAN